MLTASLQKYLLAIYQLCQKEKFVHQIDIAIQLGYSKASVSRAIHILEKEKYVVIQKKCLFLTEKGYQQALQLYTNYHFFFQLLLKHDMTLREAEFYSMQFISVVDNHFLEKINDYHIRNNIFI